MSTMTAFESAFLTVTFLFMIGSMVGWTLELFFRKFISTKNPDRKWINPGFLTGPGLPLYVFGLIGLFVMSLFPYIGEDTIRNLDLPQIVIQILAMGAMGLYIHDLMGFTRSRTLVSYPLFLRSFEKFLYNWFFVSETTRLPDMF
ncbi:MAG: hypothetical protein IKQ56_01920 [Lachnospiraceae bacterium]|nr:hypothetical protein [Lachnospiraceae bacterium]